MAFSTRFLTLSLAMAAGVLCAEDAKTNTTAPAGLGFVDLFNGKDLTNWAGVNYYYRDAA